MSPVSVVHGSGSSSICRLCLQWWLSSPRPVAPVSPVVHVSSICCRSWLLWLSFVTPVSVSHLWLLWLSFVAPVAVVSPCGSSICHVCLHYHYLLLVAPVAPVSVACGSCCSCGFNRQSSSVLAIFLPNSVLLLYLSKYR